MGMLAAVCCVMGVALVVRGYEEGDPPPEGYMPPESRSAEESLGMIRVAEGYVVELVAAEPLIADPVAFDWDTGGRMYVAQMNDYPLGVGGGGEAGGEVRLLHDDDGDGRFDRSDVFLEGLNYPTAVKSWRGGVLVCAAPDILYAEDTDGDGRADLVETLYTGFAEGNQQHRVNGLRWGMDGWLYLANGDSGGVVRSLKTGVEVNIRGADVRLKPDEGLIEAVEGQTQFGRNRDDFGNWFGGNNSNPMWQYVLPARYLERNPHVSYPSVHRDVSVAPGASPVYPISETAARFNDPDRADRFTSASSHMVVRDERLGGLNGDALICEPVHNLVRREHMSRDGYAYTSVPGASEGTGEFFASADPWSRPVMVRTGPDGAIYVADMYRLVIEHPEWIPEAWQAVLDLRAGSEMGRIYRVYPGDRVLNTLPLPDVGRGGEARGGVAGGERRAVPLISQYPWDRFRESPSRATLLSRAMQGPSGWVRDKAQELVLGFEEGSMDKAVAARSLQRPAFGERNPRGVYEYGTGVGGRVQALNMLG